MNASHRLLTGLIAGAMLAACSGGSTAPPGSSSPQSICNGGPAPYEPMVYPAPNATGVSDGNFTLVLGGPVQTGLMLEGVGLLASAAVPNPLPTPYATPSPTPSQYSGYAVGPLAAATTYTITETLAAGTPCQSTETFGKFTTR